MANPDGSGREAEQPVAAACSWCGRSIEADDGYRAYEAAGERTAAFCRLEHVVPWAIQGPAWEAGAVAEPAGVEPGRHRCSRCDAELTDIPVLFVRHRGKFRIADAFCSVEHLRHWAGAGGRWH
jgi:hypothetical protein